MNRIAMIGAGGHAKVIIEIVEACNDQVVFVNDTDANISDILNYRVSHEMPEPGVPVIVSIGNNKIRKRIAGAIANPCYTAIHPRATVSSRATLGEGTVVMAGAVINSGASVGRHCIINTNASVDHDCVIGDYAHIAPGVALAGNVSVGEGTLVGVGSSIIPGVKIGSWVTIGAGSVVIADVPDHAVVVGVPADVLKYNS